jgi:hypothetical protein
MDLYGLSPFQQELADTLWDCQTEGEVQAVINEFGNPAYTVYQLMIAAYYDDIVQTYEDINLAKEVLDNLLK